MRIAIKRGKRVSSCGGFTASDSASAISRSVEMKANPIILGQRTINKRLNRPGQVRSYRELILTIKTQQEHLQGHDCGERLANVRTDLQLQSFDLFPPWSRSNNRRNGRFICWFQGWATSSYGQDQLTGIKSRCLICKSKRMKGKTQRTFFSFAALRPVLN